MEKVVEYRIGLDEFYGLREALERSGCFARSCAESRIGTVDDGNFGNFDLVKAVDSYFEGLQ